MKYINFTIKKFSPLVLAVFIVCCGGNKANEGRASENQEGSEFSEGTQGQSLQTEEEFSEEEIAPEIDDSIPPEVCTSQDGVVTIESAMYPGLGTATEYWSRWKFKNSEGKDCEVFLAESPYITKVYSITKDDGSTYYVTNCFGRASSMDCYKWLEAYKIIGDSIEKVQVIDGRKKGGTDKGGTDKEDGDVEFTVNFSAFNSYLAQTPDSHNWTFEYDPQTREIYVPIIRGESLEEFMPTDRYILWHFDGDKFVNMGEKPNKELNPSLGDYKELLKYFETDDYIIRIDLLKDKTLRYASWKKPNTMSDTPDVVIKNGIKKSHKFRNNPDDSYDVYTFRKGNNEYVINLCETENDEFGNEWTYFYFVVKKGDKTILKERSIQ